MTPIIQIIVGLPLFLLLLHMLGTIARVLLSFTTSILDFFLRVYEWLDFIDEGLIEILPFPVADITVGLAVALCMAFLAAYYMSDHHLVKFYS